MPAYALNHAVSPAQVQSYIASSENAGQILERHVEPTAVLTADPRQTVTDYIRTKQLGPNTIPALRKLIGETTREVALYKQYKSVPPQELVYRNADQHEDDSGKTTDPRQSSATVGGRDRCQEVPGGETRDKNAGQRSADQQVECGVGATRT